MKILYLILQLWIFIALPLFVQNSIFQVNNQFTTDKQTKDKSSEQKPLHRGSGRLYIKVIKS